MCVFGIIVAAESLTHDIGWNETGPGSGYFPFRIGLLLVAAGVVLLVQQRRRETPVSFVTAEQFARSWSVFWPTTVLVAAMFPLGFYVPVSVYLAWMMRRHGGYAWPRSILSSLAVTAAFFVVFDVWFRVPLARGILGSALGLP